MRPLSIAQISAILWLRFSETYSSFATTQGFMRPLSTEAAPVATALPEPIASRQAWLTSLDGSKLGLVSLNNHIFGAGA